MMHHKLDSKIDGLNKISENKRLLKRILPLVLGIIALLWFLIRVLPKPLRATYPCMKVAYPLMSGLVVWILGLTGISSGFKLLLKYIRTKKYLFALSTLFVIVIFCFFYSVFNSAPAFVSSDQPDPVHISNEPVGAPQGIIPGRVVWIWNPATTIVNCTNDLTKTDGYFLAKNNNQEVIDIMGSKYLGRNALLNIVDGLWEGTEATQTPVK